MSKAGKILISIVALYLAAMPVYLSGRVNQTRVRGFEINISDSSSNELVTRREIESLVRREGDFLSGAGFKEVNLAAIEDLIRSRREVKTAEAYLTITGNLCVFVRQREPVMRLITGGGDFFIDDEGVLFRKRKLYTPRLHVVSGNVTIPGPVLDGMSLLDTAAGKTVLRDVFYLVRLISRDRFWSAQIDQVRVSGSGDISLIPRTAGHVVNLGDAGGIEGKLEKLGAFYEKIMPLAGWDAYSLIDLQYDGQIVCRKKPK